MKLTPQTVVHILKLIAGMRGDVTRERIHERVQEKVVKISSRQLFAQPEIHKAYEAKKAELRKKTAKPLPKVPSNAAEVIEQQRQTIARLEEAISVLYSNAAAQGVSPEQLTEPLKPIDLGNTYGRRSK